MAQCMDDSGMREKYDPERKKKPKQIINNAIRNECAGGEHALECRTAAAAVMNRYHSQKGSELYKNASISYRWLNEIIILMEEKIRAKYHLPILN